MKKEKPDEEPALKNLGQRLRDGYAEKNPAQEKDLEPVKDAVREQHEREKEAERQKKPARDAEKEQERKPQEPEPER